MIEPAHGLTDTALEAISDLERRVLAADGGRLKLEWGVLRRRSPDEVRDLLWCENGRLLGFAGIYGHGGATPEIAGMVDPDARRRGIGQRLFRAVADICRERGSERLLLVVPRNGAGGERFALEMGLVHEHSEHALTLRRRPSAVETEATVNLRQATADDIPALSRLFREGFPGDDGHVDPDRLVRDGRRTLMIDRADEAIGTISVVRERERGAIYGFVVDRALRGRGIGREVLRRVSAELFDAGATRVDLEVEVNNDGALGLYTFVGFELIATDDYYQLAL